MAKRVSTVCFIHGENKLDKAMKSMIDGLEDELELDKQVIYKRQYSDGCDVATEILRALRKLEEEGDDCKAVVMVSQHLCEVMRNNQEVCKGFQEIILGDLQKPQGEHRIALLWDTDFDASSAPFRETFSQDFADYFSQRRPGVKRRCPEDMKLPCFVTAITKQWIGPEGSIQIPTSMAATQDALSDIETVRIIHCGSREIKQVVRDVSNELEDGLKLEDPTKYRLFNRVQDHDIPAIIISEVEHIEKDGQKALGVIMWCLRFMEIMKKPAVRDWFEGCLMAVTKKSAVVHLCVGVSQYEVTKDFPKLTQEPFIPMELHEDGSMDVTNLTERVKLVLGQRRAPQKELPHTMHQDRKVSEEHKSSSVSQPGFLASGAHRQNHRPPEPRISHGDLISAVPLPSTPSQESQKGGKVLPSNFNSHSLDSNGRINNGAALHGQPTKGSSLDGHGNPNYKYVANSGSSYTGELASGHNVDPCHSQGQAFLLGKGGASHSSQTPLRGGDQMALSGPALDPVVPVASGFHQATPSVPSSDQSMVVTKEAFMSQAFGSREPVFGTMSSAEAGSFPNRYNTSSSYPNQSLTSSAYPHSFGYNPSGVPPSGSSTESYGLATNKWAPSDCPSTEMAPHNVPQPNEIAQVAASSSQTDTLVSSYQDSPHRSLGEGTQRPIASKFPRRNDSSDISQGLAWDRNIPGHLPNGPISQGHSSFQQYAVNTVHPVQPTAHRPPSCSVPSPGNQQSTFVQCSEDNQPNIISSLNIANNLNSTNAFQEEDRRECGSSNNLPNQAIGPPFHSLPPNLHEEQESMSRDGDQCSSMPTRLVEEPEIPPLPEDLNKHPIIAMPLKLQEHLKLILDPETSTGSNWRALACHFQMKLVTIRYLDSKSKSPTLELINWLEKRKENITCGDFKAAAEHCQRYDVVRLMKKFGYKD